MIEIRDLHFSYDGFPALAGITANLRQGAATAILGPNGAGKTTFLKIVAGLLRPSQGRVVIDRQEIDRLTAVQRARAVAFVPQEEEIFLPFTVEQIVLMGRSPYLGLLGFERERDREATHRAMAETEVGRFRGRSIQDLSGGERQRVLLARALAQETPLLLLDEPTTHLDIRYQIEILKICRRLQREQGKTVVMTLHDINLASLFADEIILLKGGKLAAVGPPASVLTPERIREVYGIEVDLLASQTSGKPGPDHPILVPSGVEG